MLSSGLKLYEGETSSTRLVDVFIGSHRFKVANYSLQKNLGVGNCISSAIFTVGGYDWAINYYPDGEIQEKKDYLAFFLELKSEALDIKAKFNFTMLDKKGSPSTFCKITETTFQNNGYSWGYDEFIDRETFEKSNYLNNDSFVLLCTVTIIKQSRLESTNSEPVVVPPSNLNQQLYQLLESGNGVDVTFEVEGEQFKAHKNVLAARSPVFSAQFFGLMNEKTTNQTIKIVGIQPKVFQVFLHFVYSDLVPESEGEDPMVMYQHLLVAADRYEVERLKAICENELSKKIEVENLATTLTLAEQHNCSSLKSLCFNFVSSCKILTEVMESDGFEHMTRSCPLILKELVRNLSNKK